MKITARGTERNAAAREAVHNIIGVCQKVFSEYKKTLSGIYFCKNVRNLEAARAAVHNIIGVCKKVFSEYKKTLPGIYFCKNIRNLYFPSTKKLSELASVKSYAQQQKSHSRRRSSK